MFTNLINQWHFKMYFRTRIVFPCILNHDKLARQSLRNKASVFNGKYCWLVIFRSSLMFFSFLVPYIETCNKCPTPSILYVTASEQRSNNRTALTFFMDVKVSPSKKHQGVFLYSCNALKWAAGYTTTNHLIGCFFWWRQSYERQIK